MDKNMVLQHFREVSDEANVGAYEFATEFRALGKNNSYYFGYDYNSDSRLLVIGNRDDSLETAIRGGTILPMGDNATLDQGHNRALLIERTMVAGLPLEDAARLTGAIRDYDALEQQLGDEKTATPARQAPASPTPSVEMTFRKQM